MEDVRVNLRSGPRQLALVVALLAAAVLVVPALAVDPSPSGSTTPAAGSSAEPAETEEPGESGKPNKADKAQKAERHDKTPEVDVTINGTVGQTTDADGDVEYTLTAAGKSYRIEAGPSWWWGDANPLKPFVGKFVKIIGEQEQGSDEIDVQSVDGTALRANGKPPWAGGWKVVGSKHPGWTAEKAAREAAKGKNAPGQHKDKAKDEPEASETPG